MVTYADRVKETSTTTGTGSVTLAGSVTGFRTFASVFSVSDTMYYVIDGVNADGSSSGQWEVGEGTLSGATTLARTRVIASSNSGSAVNFSAGTKYVYHTVAAEAIVPTTPGGSSGQVQYNNAGAFGGVTGITLATGSLSALAVTGGTVTSSTPVLDATQTWSTTATYTGIKLNITDSGPSNAASLLMDLQVGGSSKFRIDKTGRFYSLSGTLYLSQDAITATACLDWTSSGIRTRATVFPLNDGSFDLGLTSARWRNAYMASAGTIQFNQDVILARDAANTLALRNSTAAQTFNVYNTYANGGTDYERGLVGWSGNQFIFGSQNAGTGTARPTTIKSASNIYFQTNGSGPYWELTTSGNLVTGGGDNVYDIGASGASRPRTGYFGTSVVTPLLNSTGAVQAYSGTAIPAGGTTGSGIKVSSTSNFGVFFGSGAPSLSAAKGSLYLRSDGSTTNDRMYVNSDGSTTWTAVITAA